MIENIGRSCFVKVFGQISLNQPESKRIAEISALGCLPSEEDDIYQRTNGMA